jgi:hypothetical protein
MPRSRRTPVAGADSSLDAFEVAFLAGVAVADPPPLATTTQEELQQDENNNIEDDNIEDDNIEDDDENAVVVDGEYNALTLDNIRDGIVSQATFRSYIGDLFHFLKWVMQKNRLWLTDYGVTQIADVETRRETETIRMYRSRSIIQLKSLLRDSFNNNIIRINSITPSGFMDYVLTLKGRGNNRYLSKSSYGNKRSSLFHLFRMHNRIGYSSLFREELSNLYRGLYRSIAQHRTAVNVNVNNRAGGGTNENINNSSNNKEGKEALSVELYKELCGWLLSYGTTDGVFAYCYLVLTWNLACRGSNTASIRFQDISWSSSFDAYAISFAHSKTDQLGEEAKYLRHLYANPITPLICPVMALGMYLSSCFNTMQGNADFLFPGKDQSNRFSTIFTKCLKQNEHAVNQLGFIVGDLGTHSIRKGAVSYLASLPGGPPVAAVCIRAGWTMGKMKDIYMRYVTSGDQFVGRCLSLLPVLRPEFACSPPHFAKEEVLDGDVDWVEDLRKTEFPMVHAIAGWGRLTKMCLASMLYHHDYLVSLLHVNHVFCITSVAFRSGELLERLRSDKDLIQVTFPWNDDDNAFSGIPPHVAIMQQVQQINEKQSRLVGDFITEMKATLEDMGVNGERMSEANLRGVLADFEERFANRFGGLGIQSQVQVIDSSRSEMGRTYQPHYYGGSWKRVPKDWRWPKCGVFDLWRQWWIGDNVRVIPPIRMIKILDVKHLDTVPLSAEEMHGRTGKHKLKRRPATKVLCDMNFLMKFVHDKVVERGKFEAQITVASVDRMFLAVIDCFDLKDRDEQKRWSTVVNGIRTKNIV